MKFNFTCDLMELLNTFDCTIYSERLVTCCPLDLFVRLIFIRGFSLVLAQLNRAISLSFGMIGLCGKDAWRAGPVFPPSDVMGMD
jgi:hypothetical protein